MHVRTTTVKGKRRNYRYAQIVESYRNKKGIPTKRVIAKLGKLNDTAIANIRLALKHANDDVVLVPALDSPDPQAPSANLRFLDVAVAWQTWRSLGLGQLLAKLLDDGDDSVAASDVVGSLVVQRCIAQGSKLYAYRWFPTTALPELTGIEPTQFNNSRLHRVLERLDGADGMLQQRLPDLCRQHKGSATCIFLDVTDTYFVGGCCDIAEYSKVKEGFYRKAIGIVLACDEQGLPLRWQVVSARRNDGRVLGDMVQKIQGCDWVGDSPVVCDRSMGNATGIEKLATSGLKYLVGVPANEYDSHTRRIPHEGFADVAVKATESTEREDTTHAARVAVEMGMEKVHDNLFALSLQTDDAGASPTAAARNLRRALDVQADIEGTGVKSHAEYARRRNISKSRLAQLLGPTRLAPDLQREILAGRAKGLTDEEMRRLYRLDHDRQRVAFRPYRVEDGLAARCPRLVVYFNPAMFVEQRQKAYEDRVETDKVVADLNQRLASPRSKMTAGQVRVKIRNHLSGRRLLDCYEVDVTTVRHKGGKHLFVSARLNESAWQRRRRYDGFVLLAAHPDLPHSAGELSRLYRLKETVERDFRTIKSTVKVRPIYHYTAAKVRAHVTLCVLALLLERSIERTLRAARTALSAPWLFEVLGTCHLNFYGKGSKAALYTLTTVSPLQRRLLKSLRMGQFATAEQVLPLLKARRFGPCTYNDSANH